MPTSTFYNLPEEKRAKLLAAIRQEFSRAPFAEASINKIIQAAGIPRGSFYQYFEDKQDALNYLLTDYRHKILECVKNSMETSGGDIFILFADVLDFTIELDGAREMGALMKNLFANMRVNGNFYLDFARKNFQEFPEAFMRRINMEILDVSSQEELKNMLEILSSVTRDAAVKYYKGRASAEEARCQHKEKIQLLKRGFMKEKENTQCCK